ncbi:MAG: NAD(P)-binding domain-containing protein, partial [Acetatifactor sp.]|nr:NAD(P)-binding domain-containing protein [Acetatifactor sp.]
MKIGFIGLGIMGKPMVRNLVSAGYEVLVWNRSQKAVEEAAAGGAVPSDKKQIGEEADLIFTMHPNSPQVKEVSWGRTDCFPICMRGRS